MFSITFYMFLFFSLGNIPLLPFWKVCFSLIGKYCYPEPALPYRYIPSEVPRSSAVIRASRNWIHHSTPQGSPRSRSGSSLRTAPMCLNSCTHVRSSFFSFIFISFVPTHSQEYDEERREKLREILSGKKINSVWWRVELESVLEK